MNCDSDTSTLLTYDQALDKLLSQANPITQTESVSIYNIDGRVLAQDLTSPINVPPFDNSSMDGYAINNSGYTNNDLFTVIDTSLAGHPATKTVLPGEAVRIMTGAKIPNGTSSVVMQENVERLVDTIKIRHMPNAGDNIRFAGEDIKKSQCLLPKGKVLTARDSALIASCGIAEILVYRKVKVGLFSTGDELVLPGHTITSGQIYDANRPLLINLLNSMDTELSDLGLLPDRPEDIRYALTEAAQHNDIIITSGGVSVGDADYIKQILAEIGNVNFWKVAMKPGKPLAFGFIGNCAFLGLPGNPVSAAVTFDQLAKPFIKLVQNHPLNKPMRQTAIACADFKKQPGRMEFQRGIATCNGEGQWEVASAGIQGSAILSALSQANCHVILEQDSCGVQKGDTVTICLY